MPPTSYPHINGLLDILLQEIKAVLGSKLVGLYLFGSLVYGDFDDDVSDIDLLAAIASDLDPAEFEALNQMQRDFVKRHPERTNRLEILYVSLRALKIFKTQAYKIGVVSPGEPFHIVDAGRDWLINWYPVRVRGVTLYGPLPTEIIEPISHDEFMQVVKDDHMTMWRARIDEISSQPSQAYAILTMCRALYTYTTGEQASKPQAAQWVAGRMPEWASLINRALIWRKMWRQPDRDYEKTLPETRQFVQTVIDQIR